MHGWREGHRSWLLGRCVTRLALALCLALPPIIYHFTNSPAAMPTRATAGGQSCVLYGAAATTRYARIRQNNAILRKCFLRPNSSVGIRVELVVSLRGAPHGASQIEIYCCFDKYFDFYVKN